MGDILDHVGESPVKFRVRFVIVSNIAVIKIDKYLNILTQNSIFNIEE